MDCFISKPEESANDSDLIKMKTNQLDSDSHLPPRKRLLAGFKKLNSNGNGSSSSSSSTSNGSSSSASTHVNTHLDNLLASRFNIDHNQSPEELVEATRSAAALAVKAAKAARAMANEKALVSAKAIAAAKRALELVDSFPKEAVAVCKERSSKKKHVNLQDLYSKGELRDEEDDLARRLHPVIDNRYPEVLGTRLSYEENGKINKKQKKTVVDSVVDSDSSYEGLESNRKVFKAFEPEEVGSIPTPGKEEGNSLGRRRGRVKLKKLPLSICNSKDQENGTSSASPLPVAQPVDEGVVSWKCQDLKVPECVKQNKAVRL